jgi:hypothetical protein
VAPRLSVGCHDVGDFFWQQVGIRCVIFFWLYVIFFWLCDFMSADIVSFFAILCRFFKNDTTSADFRSVWKNDFMSVVVVKKWLYVGPTLCSFLFWLYDGIEKWHNVGTTLCHFFCSKFDRRRVIFSDSMSVIEKRFYVDPTLCHFYLILCRSSGRFRQIRKCIFMKYFYKGKFTQISDTIFLFF